MASRAGDGQRIVAFVGDGKGKCIDSIAVERDGVVGAQRQGIIARLDLGCDANGGTCVNIVRLNAIDRSRKEMVGVITELQFGQLEFRVACTCGLETEVAIEIIVVGKAEHRGGVVLQRQLCAITVVNLGQSMPGV